MGTVVFPLREFYDSTSEIVGIKSGLLLNRFQINTFLQERGHQDEFLQNDNLDELIRIRSNDIEDMLLSLRQRIGNLPAELPTAKDYAHLRAYAWKTGQLDLLGAAPTIGFMYLRDNPGLSNVEMAELIRKDHAFDEQASLAIANIALERHDLSCVIPESKSWDGATELSNLFDCEIKSNGDFLEQKFIDYLAGNGHEFVNIHWRNFERFCAQYFKNLGYDILLGPGTNDGGTDIRVFKDAGGAPEMMIQCKRYSLENKVEIEAVKAFYTDVIFEGAKKGLIVTTGYIAKGGKKVCDCRGYTNMSFAEAENVRKWAREMGTYR